MKLFATGFNAWSQLLFHQPYGTLKEPDDLHSFTCILEYDRISSVHSSLTSTEVTTSRGNLVAGAPTSGTPAITRTDHLSCEALNGRIVTYNKNEGIIRQYLPSGQNEEFSFELPHVVQLIAYDVGFAALTSEGQVWTWGDCRFSECLGRDVDDKPAEYPGLVTALEDLPTGPVTKIAAGGYAFSAVTRGQDMYCWGRYVGLRQYEHVINDLTGDPEPVVVSKDDGLEELDVVDVGMGDSHMIILATDGYVYVVGNNTNGQLGLGKDVSSTAPSGWTKIEGIPKDGQRVVGVYAGPKTSFVVVDG